MWPAARSRPGQSGISCITTSRCSTRRRLPETESLPSRASPLPHLTEFYLWNATKCGSGLAREGALPDATGSMAYH
ncbi:hypothetical protein DXU77_12310 [Pseudomonas lactis]|nr:hypothetical protein [Pseudomonas lactis]